ncbi:MAG TPA: hypothetical protein VGS12_04170 [Caulobacteraceae bacterium]|nr:hypothetical protein [Caulobacteraceae bacterium]
MVEIARQRRFIADHQVLHEARRGHTGQIGPACSGGQRQRQADQVMRRIADDSLVQVTNLHGDAASAVSQRAKVAQVTVATDPDRRSLGHVRRASFQPFVEFSRAAAHIGMRGASHLDLPHFRQAGGPICRPDHAAMDGDRSQHAGATGRPLIAAALFCQGMRAA